MSPLSIPFIDIRKIRQASFDGGQDIWRNPEFYHVVLSHPNQYVGRKQGRIQLELREDLPKRTIENYVSSIEKVIPAISHNNP
jgi:hypothetical protein